MKSFPCLMWIPVLITLAGGCAAPGGDTDPSDPGGEPATTISGSFHGQPWRDPDRTPRAAPAGAHLNYHGGRVVSSMKVIEVVYGSGSFLPQVTGTATPNMPTFYQGVLNSAYVDWLTEYNTTTVATPRSNQVIGRGSFVQRITITPAAARNGKTIPQGGSNSCQAGGFCAYHSTISNAGGHGEVYYGVHPDMQAGSGCDTGCGNGTAFANQQSVASHEMVEAITDPEIGLATRSEEHTSE